jgi:hypothetical protein
MNASQRFTWPAPSTPFSRRGLWFLAAGGIAGAVVSLLFGTILGIFSAFALGALACWRTDHVLVGIGTTGVGLLTVAINLPWSPTSESPVTLAGAALAALFIVAPLVYAASEKARRKVFEVQERLKVAPPPRPAEEKTVVYFVISPYRQYENPQNPALWN